MPKDKIFRFLKTFFVFVILFNFQTSTNSKPVPPGAAAQALVPASATRVRHQAALGGAGLLRVFRCRDASRSTVGASRACIFPRSHGRLCTAQGAVGASRAWMWIKKI